MSKYSGIIGGLWYHGSTFSIDRLAYTPRLNDEQSLDQEGPGIYLTTDIDDARRYGKFVHETRITDSRADVITPGESVKTRDKREAYTLIRSVEDWELYAQDWDEDPERGLRASIDTPAKDRADFWQNIWFHYFRHDSKGFVSGMSKVGITGALHQRNDGVWHLVLYKPENAAKPFLVVH